MIRVVADTNIFISALMFGGMPGTFMDFAFVKSFQLVTSPVLLDEAAAVVHQLFAFDARLILAPEDGARGSWPPE